MIDTKAINTEEPIDLTTICFTNFYKLDPKLNHFGVHLTDEGINEFKAKVNIEVQFVREPVIAAIEKNGGVITTAYYDMTCVKALHNPIEFFKKGFLSKYDLNLNYNKVVSFRGTDTQTNVTTRRRHRILFWSKN